MTQSSKSNAGWAVFERLLSAIKTMPHYFSRSADKGMLDARCNI